MTIEVSSPSPSSKESPANCASSKVSAGQAPALRAKTVSAPHIPTTPARATKAAARVRKVARFKVGIIFSKRMGICDNRWCVLTAERGAGDNHAEQVGELPSDPYGDL